MQDDARLVLMMLNKDVPLLPDWTESRNSLIASQERLQLLRRVCFEVTDVDFSHDQSSENLEHDNQNTTIQSVLADVFN